MATLSGRTTSHDNAMSNQGPSGPSMTATTSRPRSGRPKTAASIVSGVRDQTIICAINESRGVSPTVGLALINMTTYEAVLSQICDSQTFVKTIHKLAVYKPSQILFMSTASDRKSKLYLTVEENLPEVELVSSDRKFWAENTGLEYLHQHAFKEDLEALKATLGANFFATCCFSAVMKYVDIVCHVNFAFHSLRIKYEPSEGSMMIDLSTIVSFELIQNLQNSKSKDCLFGLLNQTLTPMGSRFLRGTILQPSTDTGLLEGRYDALEELTMKEEMFYAVRQALKNFVDTDKILSALITIPKFPTYQYSEQSINNIVMLKQFVISINPIYEALTGCKSSLLDACRELCRPGNTQRVADLIHRTINEDVTYQTKPLDLRNQRTYAVRSGVNGFLDVARTSYRESNGDVYEYITQLGNEYDMPLELKFGTQRQYYIRIPTTEFMDRPIPDEFINVYRNKKWIECQTLDLVKLNQKIQDAYHEVVKMSDNSIQDLISQIRREMYSLFKISECIATLDMLASFAQVITTQDYVRPELTETLAIKDGRHPIHEKIHSSIKFVPNDVYATQSTRFQVITGCNMSGKSTYIRSIALLTIMAQIGCFVPAQYASFPVRHSLFARVTSADADISANVSTFSAEMREMAFILRNITPRNSMVIIDEIGRGTSTTDGLHIALAISEALLQSFSLVWFATHFHDLARILAPRPGVLNMHLEVEMPDPHASASGTSPSIKMLYRVSQGPVPDRNYGLALASVVGLPEPVLNHAATVSTELRRISEAKREAETAKAISVAKRRKLLLNLKEELYHSRDSDMEGEEIRAWLEKLKGEFYVRMGGIDAAQRIRVGPGPGPGHEELEGTVIGESMDNNGRQEESQGTYGTPATQNANEISRSPSVVEVDQHGKPIDVVQHPRESELAYQDHTPSIIVKGECTLEEGGKSMGDEPTESEEDGKEWYDHDMHSIYRFDDGDELNANEDKDWMRID